MPVFLCRDRQFVTFIFILWKWSFFNLLLLFISPQSVDIGRFVKCLFVPTLNIFCSSSHFFIHRVQ